MGERPARLTASEVEHILARNGFRFVSQRGSHRKWRHDEMRAQVIVPSHQGKVLPIGTLHAIQAASGIPPDAWQT